MDDRCGTCKYFCEVRKSPTYQEILTHICVLFIVEEGTDYIIETSENDICECYQEYKK